MIGVNDRYDTIRAIEDNCTGNKEFAFEFDSVTAATSAAGEHEENEEQQIKDVQ